MNECELVELVRNVKTYTHAHITDNKKQKQTLVDTITNNHLWRVMRLRTDTTLGQTDGQPALLQTSTKHTVGRNTFFVLRLQVLTLVTPRISATAALERYCLVKRYVAYSIIDHTSYGTEAIETAKTYRNSNFQKIFPQIK